MLYEYVPIDTFIIKKNLKKYLLYRLWFCIFAQDFANNFVASVLYNI